MTDDLTARTRTAHDGALQPAVRRFEDAVSALIDPRCEIVDGRRCWLDSLYSELADSLAGQQGYAGERVPRSLPILWLEAHDVLAEIDRTVAQWRGDGKSTPARLAALSEAKYRPQDTTLLTDRAARLESFAKAIKGLLLPEIVVYLRGHHCPVCGHSHIRRTDSGGAEVTAPALVIHGDEALCAHCRTVWEYSRLPLLGRMLGVQPTAIVGGS